MKEATIVKEYKMKCKEHILTLQNSHSEIHEFQGYIYNDYLNLQYFNEDINGILKITVAPVQNKLGFYVHNGAKFYSLKIIYKHYIILILIQHMNLSFRRMVFNIQLQLVTNAI